MLIACLSRWTTSRYSLNLIKVGVIVFAAFPINLSHAQQTKSADNANVVTVHGTRNPVDKSYRKMVEGMDLFEKYHYLAPQASLRYKLLPRLPGTDMENIVMKVVGDSISIPVPIAPDNTFTLERNAKALDEDASVMPNRLAHSMTWRADIRTPGLAPNARRLGDLRLECRVGFEAGLISEGIPIIGSMAMAVQKVITLNNPCYGNRGHYFLFADHPIFQVKLIAGNRQEIVSIDDMYAGLSFKPKTKFELSFFDCQSLIDRTYTLPLDDTSWPDDTLIEFVYIDDQFNGNQTG